MNHREGGGPSVEEMTQGTEDKESSGNSIEVRKNFGGFDVHLGVSVGERTPNLDVNFEGKKVEIGVSMADLTKAVGTAVEFLQRPDRIEAIDNVTAKLEGLRDRLRKKRKGASNESSNEEQDPSDVQDVEEALKDFEL